MQFRGAEILNAWLVRFCMMATNIFSKIIAVPFLTKNVLPVHIQQKLPDNTGGSQVSAAL